MPLSLFTSLFSAHGVNLTREDLLKLWKGLFYCMWMSDKPLVQEELARKLAGLVACFQTHDGGNFPYGIHDTLICCGCPDLFAHSLCLAGRAQGHCSRVCAHGNLPLVYVGVVGIFLFLFRFFHLLLCLLRCPSLSLSFSFSPAPYSFFRQTQFLPFPWPALRGS